MAVRQASLGGLDVDLETRTNVEKLKRGIAEFYDQSSGIWEDIWGDHMHHGFYDPNSTVSLSDHRAAQVRMIEEALQFASIPGNCVLSVFLNAPVSLWIFIYMLY